MAKGFDLDDLKDVDVKGLDKAEELVETLDTDKLDDVLGMFKKDK